MKVTAQGKMKTVFDIENQEEDCDEVVAHMDLGPVPADGEHAAFVGDALGAFAGERGEELRADEGT